MRERFVVGPTDLGGRARQVIVVARRYQCQRCEAVMVVVPQGVLPRLRYTLVAVVTALAQWGHGGRAGWRVRADVSPWQSSGDERLHGWRALRRWLTCSLGTGLYVDASASPRARAASMATQLAAMAPLPTGVVTDDAVCGALHR
ncbi:MAG: hypothetical protein H6716_20655 [Polyangiaceae bacterium]|nr:hypothetical protein [Polyangiaceae bacterium]